MKEPLRGPSEKPTSDTAECGTLQKGSGGYLFQGRFGSCVLDEKHLAAAVRYGENNPVRAGIVERAWEYPWSSAKYHLGERETDALVRDRKFWGQLGDWKAFLH